MSTASIVFGNDVAQHVSIVWLDNRGSESSLESDLKEAFDSFSSIDLTKPARLGAQILDWYEQNRSTVKAQCPTWLGDDDATHVILDCSTADSEGRPVGEVLFPATGESNPLVYGG